MPSQSGTSHISEPSEEHGTLFQVPPLLSACFPLAVISYIPSIAGQSTQSSSLGTARSPVRGARRGHRKISAQATKLEAVDDSVDPLGPLGESSSFDQQAPTPPQKEPLAQRNAPPTSSSRPSTAGLSDSVALEEDGAGIRGPPPVQPPTDAEGQKRQPQPSISVEEAARPTFYITVGDPHKVGDLTSSHIVYQVRTKVLSTDHSQLSALR